MQETETNPYEPIMYAASQGGEAQDPNSLYSDIMREERVRNVISQINPDLLLEDIEHRIRGEIKDRYTQEWKSISRDKKNKVSEELIANYISFLGSILNQNTALSNFKASEINNIMYLIVEYLRDDLSDNDEEYGFVKKKEITETIFVNKMIRYKNKEDVVTYKYQQVPMEIVREIERSVDNNEMTRIANIICISTFAVFKRAENGMEARRIFGSLKVSENMSQAPQKKGFMDLLNFGR